MTALDESTGTAARADVAAVPEPLWYLRVNTLRRSRLSDPALRALLASLAAAERWAGGRDGSPAGQQPGRGIESDPAGARKVHFGPRMQVRKIGGGAGRSFERLHVGHELNQIAGNEARRESQMAHDLDLQPSRIAA